MYIILKLFGNHEKECFMAYDLFVLKMLNFEALLSKPFVRKITVSGLGFLTYQQNSCGC